LLLHLLLLLSWGRLLISNICTLLAAGQNCFPKWTVNVINAFLVHSSLQGVFAIWCARLVPLTMRNLKFSSKFNELRRKFARKIPIVSDAPSSKRDKAQSNAEAGDALGIQF